jgi:hypothetical protein
MASASDAIGVSLYLGFVFPVVEIDRKRFNVLGVFLVSSHAGREVLSISALILPTRSHFFMEMNAGEL